MTTLTYYPDSEPGIFRSRRGRGFSYVAADGTRIDNVQERERLAAMAVPPAYEDVWMSPIAHGHLLATGRDIKGRKQYLYHPDWRRLRDEKKFEHLPKVGETLPELRRWIDRQLAGDVGDQSTAIAAVLALLDRASLRPGDERNTRENQSFGATTLRNRHIDFDGEMIQLAYRAKGGKQVNKSLRGSRLARVLEARRDLPGASLITWTDDNDASRIVRSDEVNDTLGELCGPHVTAKSLRTWNGTHAAFVAASGPEKATIKLMSDAASKRLHNTPSIARNSYIHPRVIDISAWNNNRRQKFVDMFDMTPQGAYPLVNMPFLSSCKQLFAKIHL